MAHVWRVGVDAGGTWLRVLAIDARGRRLMFRGPAPAVSSLPESLESMWRRRRWPRAAVARLVVATRGVWTEAERRRMRQRLRGLARRVSVMSDAEAALRGALGDRPGVLVLAGTGAIVLSRDRRGRLFRVGGLGPLFGDAGSAFVLGRDWLAAADPSRALRLARGPDAVARIAALAPLVLRLARRGDGRASRAVSRGALALALDIRAAARQARLRAPVSVSWAGRLLQDQRYRDLIWRMARRRGLAPAPVAPRMSALEAAARLAAGPTPARAIAGAGAAARPRARGR